MEFLEKIHVFCRRGKQSYLILLQKAPLLHDGFPLIIFILRGGPTMFALWSRPQSENEI